MFVYIKSKTRDRETQIRMTFKRKNLDPFGPGTINSDDEIDNFSEEDSESDDETKHKKKKTNKGTDFFGDFKFVDSSKDYQRDTWDDVMQYMKPKNSVDIDVKIAKHRQEQKEKRKQKKLAKKNGKEIKKEEGEKESSEDEWTEDEDDEDYEDMSDKVKRNERAEKIKEKQKERGKQRKKLPEEIQEEEDMQYFDDAPPIDTSISFQEMNLSRPLLKAVSEVGYDNPTPIQAATIPVALQGRDVCGCASTGTGKTAAFMLPILERLLFKPKEDIVCRVLILVPTRELGVQVYQVARQLSRFTEICVALSVGGLDLKTQEAALRKSPDIVIATPGRLIDHLKNTPNFNLDSIEILVLDEADRMLDEYFAEQMKEIIKQCAPIRQTMLFSATMTTGVKELATVSLSNPVKMFVNSNTDVAQNLRQEFVRLRAAQENDREAVLAYLLLRNFHDHTMVFIQTKAQCHRLHIMMGLLGIRVGELHGNLSQTQRLESLKKFKDEEIDVLLVTDVAARGLDIKGVKTVMNFTMPPSYSTYVHRVGRTARAGRCGRSVSISSEGEYKMLKEIKKSSTTAMFERVVNKDIVSKYKARMDKLEPTLKQIIKEELDDKELKEMEAKLNKMKNKVQGKGREEREWFQNRKQRQEEQSRLAIDEDGGGGKKGKKNQKKGGLRKGAKADERISRELDVAQRIAKAAAKRGVKGSPFRTKVDMDFLEDKEGRDKPNLASKKKNKENMGQKGKKGNKSSFTKELTRTDDKSLKKYRNSLSYEERKDTFKKKNPGKKFKPNQGKGKR
ncbi:unnamed protein product [Meganyctiphanes norvegica]|uniref:RNA helicase n=1 Tax=Meganyctiphanes norvegica TaxID=48144 RepID=A0AAV2Q413_MEGNR